MMEAPRYDKRSASDIAWETHALLGLDRLTPSQRAGRFDAALVQVFARFSELIIERLNRAPEKNLLAFLDLIGVSRLPMEAAVVPLTFFLAPGAANHAIVRAGTRVAAPPGKGSQKPVIFETETELVVTSAQLDCLFTKNGERDEYSDLSAALLQQTDRPVAPQAAAIPHVFYMALPISSAWPNLDQLRIQFVLDQPLAQEVDPRSVQWEVPVAPTGVPSTDTPALKVLIPDIDETLGLTRSGAVVFRNLPSIRSLVLNEQSGQWLSCRLLTPMTASADPREGMLRQSQCPLIKDVSVELVATKNDLPIDLAFQEKLKLDVSKDFFPFGERPKLGDTLYLGSREAFSNPDAKIILHVQLANPNTSGRDVGIPRTKPNGTELCWEFWDGKKWSGLSPTGRRLRLGSEDGDAASEFEDQTQAFSQNGDIVFRFPSAPAELNLNGQKNYWIRVRIAGGDYGRELQLQRNEATGGFTTTPATLAPPCIHSLKLDYTLEKEAKPQSLLYNDFEYERVPAESAFRPFLADTAERAVPSLYFGFKVAGSSTPKGTSGRAGIAAAKQERVEFPKLPVSAYVVLQSRPYEEVGIASGQAASVWEYWTGTAWRKFTVSDGTQGMSKSGLLQFLVPGDFTQSEEIGKRRYWLRMRLNSAGDAPRLSSVFMNTTTAVQGVTVSNDILGSSNGEPNQLFHTTQPSVLPGEKLEVRETTPPAPPKPDKLGRHAFQEEDSISPAKAIAGKTEQWVTWQEVEGFHTSSPRDRHYILDRPKGEVRFGDGICGMIPPVLAGNIRMTRYRSGGGASGNQPVQAIKQLVSAVPYIQKVVNWIPARGGNDPEAHDTILERGPREIRHRGRAVTAEDFEDLALLASREVARAKCVPRCDLASDPSAKRKSPGSVSVIVVPHSPDPKPVPSSELLDRVRTFLDSRRLPTAGLVVIGPQYVRVDVETEIVIDRLEDASDAEQRVAKALASYLHPTSGGPNRCGWDFGRLPQKFDLYVLIERVPGVSHIRDLNVNISADAAGAEKTEHFLVYCGHCKITMTLLGEICR